VRIVLADRRLADDLSRGRIERPCPAPGLSVRAPWLSVQRVEVNGGPGAPSLDADQPLIVVLAIDIADGQITRIGAIANPDKLAHLAMLRE
jgi:hypothetical protein